jgi:hypothetical protein
MIYKKMDAYFVGAITVLFICSCLVGYASYNFEIFVNDAVLNGWYACYGMCNYLEFYDQDINTNMIKADNSDKVPSCFNPCSHKHSKAEHIYMDSYIYEKVIEFMNISFRLSIINITACIFMFSVYIVQMFQGSRIKYKNAEITKSLV